LFHSVDEQTIIAQCTPRASGAIALLRVSGINAIAIVDTISKLGSDKKLSTLPSHTIHYGFVIESTGATVDQVMFLLMHGPRTFTGQDTVEITCHNNQFIIEHIISLAISAGARLAQEGEFTKRAVLNGKIDLVQAEAINELIHAQTQMALKKSLAQLTGSFSYWLNSLEKDLLKALAFSEASFEFIDEEISFAPQIQTIIQSVSTTIGVIKKTFNQQQQIRQGIRIALIGSVNAGKSSLFNALLNQERAIVTAIAGTTRDAIEAGLYNNGNFWTLVDTAGLRETDDVIEQEGIKRSFQEAHKADIILLAYDSSRTPSTQEQTIYDQLHADYTHKIISIHTKSDLITNPNNNRDAITVSSKTKNNIAHLEQAIEQKIATLFTGIESPFLLNQRQYNLLLALETHLITIDSMVGDTSVAYELLSIHLNDAIACIAELSGKAISEAGMDMVFREFCIGK